MAVINMIIGATTHNSALVVARVSGGGPVRVAYATDPEMDDPQWSDPAPVAIGTARVPLSGLTPGARYWWRVEDAAGLDDSVTGQFVTDPAPAGEPVSFTVGVCGDAGLTPTFRGVTGAAPGRLSNHPAFDTLRTRALAEGWLRLIHLGDLTYYDLGSGNHGLAPDASVAQYRAMWDDVLAQPRQAELYRSVPWVYIWDDHDYGPNNSHSEHHGRSAACQVFRERAACYDLPAAQPIYHSWQIGRVLFLAADSRADRIPGQTLLGPDQIAWTESVLAASEAAALVWLMPNPWLGPSADSWGGFRQERDQLVQMLGDLGWLDRMAMVSADKHVCALDSGSHPEAGGFPNMVAAGIDATIGSITHQYDGGMWAGRGQYGTVSVHDTGRDVTITLTAWRGRRALGWTRTGGQPSIRIPAGTPSHVLAL